MTLVFSSCARISEAVAMLKEVGFKVVQVKNKFFNPTPMGYRDLNLLERPLRRHTALSSPLRPALTTRHCLSLAGCPCSSLLQQSISHDTRAARSLRWPLRSPMAPSTCARCRSTSSSCSQPKKRRTDPMRSYARYVCAPFSTPLPTELG